MMSVCPLRGFFKLGYAAPGTCSQSVYASNLHVIRAKQKQKHEPSRFFQILAATRRQTYRQYQALYKACAIKPLKPLSFANTPEGGRLPRPPAAGIRWIVMLKYRETYVVGLRPAHPPSKPKTKFVWITSLLYFSVKNNTQMVRKFCARGQVRCRRGTPWTHPTRNVPQVNSKNPTRSWLHGTSLWTVFRCSIPRTEWHDSIARVQSTVCYLAA